MSSEIRSIKSTNCFCKFCKQPIPKGEDAFVFDTKIAGDHVQIQLHKSCLRQMYNQLVLYEHGKSIEYYETKV